MWTLSNFPFLACQGIPFVLLMNPLRGILSLGGNVWKSLQSETGELSVWWGMSPGVAVAVLGQGPRPYHGPKWEEWGALVCPLTISHMLAGV
jgi:hypothetical protein